MANTISVEILALSITTPEFWRLVRWCHTHGANEFTLSATGSGKDGSHVVALFERARKKIARFALEEDTRWAPLDSTWKVASRSLFKLTYESIAVLSSLGLDHHFFPGNGKGSGGRENGDAELHYLCLYRETRPMLALFEEQGVSVNVILRREELESFHAGSFGPENAIHENYFPEYFG